MHSLRSSTNTNYTSIPTTKTTTTTAAKHYLLVGCLVYGARVFLSYTATATTAAAEAATIQTIYEGVLATLSSFL